MKIFQDFVNYVGVIAAGVSVWFGDLPSVVRILLILMVIDIFMGVVGAGIKGIVSSSQARSGMMKKFITLGVIALAYLVGQMLAGPTLGAPFGEMTAGFYIAVESISILENAQGAGIPIPDFLQNALKAFNDKQAEQLSQALNDEGTKG